MSTMRRMKWHPPQPPSPQILHLPRRHRRKQRKSTTIRPISGRDPPEACPTHHHKAKLSTLFHQEQRTSVPIVLLNSGDCERRERVREEDKEDEMGQRERGISEGEWRFQAEILRAECNFLRAEREFALKKLEKTRLQLDKILSSAVQTLIAGRNKIREGKSVSWVLEEEIEEMAKKLRKLKRSSMAPGFELKKCSNFDKQALLLQKQVQRIDSGISNEKSTEQIQKIAESSLSIISASCSADETSLQPSTDVETLRREMEKMSKGMLMERMEEELGSVLSTAIISPADTFASLTSRSIEPSDSSPPSVRHHYQESMGQEESTSTCQGQCKAVVRRVMEQVRAETEQWTQMQQMLGQVRQEMEDLQASRDFWEDQALHSNSQMHSLSSHLRDWKHKAVASETKAKELQQHVTVLHGKLEKLRVEKITEAVGVAIAKDSQTEKEKRVLICQLKENSQCGRHSTSKLRQEREKVSDGRRRRVKISSNSGQAVPKRSALKDIGNVSPLFRHYKK